MMNVDDEFATLKSFIIIHHYQMFFPFQISFSVQMETIERIACIQVAIGVKHDGIQVDIRQPLFLSQRLYLLIEFPDIVIVDGGRTYDVVDR